MIIERKNYLNLATTTAPFVSAVRHDEALYLSGITAYSMPSRRKGIRAQTADVLQSIKEIALLEGSCFQDILSITAFLTKQEYTGGFNQIFHQWFNQDIPAGSIVYVNKLFRPELKIEIQATILVDSVIWDLVDELEANRPLN